MASIKTPKNHNGKLNNSQISIKFNYEGYLMMIIYKNV